MESCFSPIAGSRDRAALPQHADRSEVPLHVLAHRRRAPPGAGTLFGAGLRVPADPPDAPRSRPRSRGSAAPGRGMRLGAARAGDTRLPGSGPGTAGTLPPRGVPASADPRPSGGVPAGSRSERPDSCTIRTPRSSSSGGYFRGLDITQDSPSSKPIGPGSGASTIPGVLQLVEGVCGQPLDRSASGLGRV
jgi:hypothetical protein